MKIKKIAAVCKEFNCCILHDRVDRDGAVQQWISNRAALYPVTGLPYLKLENLVTMFELTKKQVDGMQMDATGEPEEIDLRDVAPDEKRAELLPLTICYGGRKLLPIITQGIVRFLDRRLLVPITGRYDDIEFYQRLTAGGAPYFVVKEGLLLVGVVLPMQKCEATAGLMRSIGAKYREIEREEEGQANEADGQETML